MKKKKLQYKELRSLDSAIEQLQELVNGLRAGALSLGRGEQQLQLKPGAVLDFGLYAEREGVQERFELVLEWRRQDLTIGSGPTGASALPKSALPKPRSMVVPAARGLALQAEAERLFEEDDSEAPLSSDDDDLLAVDMPADSAGDDDTMAADTMAADTIAPDDVDVPLLEGVRAAAAANAVVAQDEIDDEAVTVRHSTPPEGQLAAARQARHSDAERFQQLYAAARAPAADGQLRLDEQRFADSLVAAGLETPLQQELCSLARQADAEQREHLFKEPRISELISSTLSGAA